MAAARTVSCFAIGGTRHNYELDNVSTRITLILRKRSMSFLDKLRPPKRPGLRCSDEALRWASRHFPESHRRIAAIVAGILCEQTGVDFSELHAATHFMNEMNVHEFFDASSYASAVQQEFHLEIPEQDLAKMDRLSDLVEYLYERASQGNPAAS